MKAVLLLAVIALGIFSYKKFLGPYHALVTITVPDGTRYEVLKIPDDCQMIPGTCIGRFGFVSGSKDTVGVKREAAGLLPWVQTQGVGRQRKAVLLIGIKPGFARMLKPEYAAGVVYLWDRDQWRYGGSQELPVAQAFP